jgi:hypothetical protein
MTACGAFLPFLRDLRVFVVDLQRLTKDGAEGYRTSSKRTKAKRVESGDQLLTFSEPCPP